MSKVHTIQPSPASKSVQELDDFLKSYPQVKLVKIQWVNLTGVTVTRVVPIQTLRLTLETGGVHSGSSSLADLMMPATNELIPEHFSLLCDIGRIVPDTSSLRMCRDSAGIGNTAVVNAFIDFYDTDPRLLLTRKLASAEKQHGLKFLVGIELEFILVELDRKTPVSIGTKSFNTEAVTGRSRLWPVLNDALVALADAGIHAIEGHKEYGSSQLEIALPPLPPLESIDAAVYARETIKDIAYKHNMIATFYPDPFAEGEPGSGDMHNGHHIHISAAPISTSNSFDPDRFLGGLLAHIPALCAIGMPLIDSYSRSGEGHLAAGGRVGYGTNNRDMPIRLVTKNHWEIRTSDATANHYLLVAAIISAGLDPQPLTWKDINKFPPILSEEEQKNLGPVQPLPKNLSEALEALEKDDKWAKQALGEELLRWYFAVKRHELEYQSKQEDKERKPEMVRYY